MRIASPSGSHDHTPSTPVMLEGAYGTGSHRLSTSSTWIVVVISVTGTPSVSPGGGPISSMSLPGISSMFVGLHERPVKSSSTASRRYWPWVEPWSCT